jgi:cation-transporting ATPase I
MAEEPRVLHTIPGRMRVHMPEWEGQGKYAIEAQVRRLPGVQRVQANTLTGNMLIVFDPTVTSEQPLLEKIRTLDLHLNEQLEYEQTLQPPTLKERHGKKIRARVAVRGMSRDPEVARRVVERLESHPGVHATANPVTGRVLVEFTEHEADLEDLLSDVSSVELPDLPGEDTPTHPLDPGPLIQGTTRIIGSVLGLGLLVTRQLIGSQAPLPGAGVAVQISSVIGILQGIPPIRYGLRRLLGRTTADLLVNVPNIATLTLAGSPLGLAVTGAESLRLTTEVSARQAAWRQYEEQISQSPSIQPEAIIHLEAGEQLPMPSQVLEGTGTAIGRDAMPLPVSPGRTVPAGARLYGGPFTLKVQSDAAFKAFTPEPRPAPITPTLYDRYLQFLGPISLLYAAGTAIVTRSWNLTLAALLLVNPRTAAIGNDNADLAAAARVLRAGVTIVGTRPKRHIRLPNTIMLDGARVLTERLELLSTLPLTDQHDSAELQARAAGIASAAGSPWGGIFRVTGTVPATHGSFDGKTATATVEGVRYTLGPVEDWSSLPEATRLRQRGNYVLVLRREQESQPLGLFALRPKIAAGIDNLIQLCQRYNIELGVLGSGDQIAVQALAHRANIAVIESDNAVDAIRARQQQGAIVAFVSDHVGASAAFASCDLAIGLTDGRSHFPARADMLAPDFVAVAAIIDAGARREATVRDSVGFSVVANAVGAFLGIRGLTGIEQASRTVYIAALGALTDGWLRFRGGKRPGSALAHLTDPHPERWGQRDVQDVLHQLNSCEEGLSKEQAAERHQLAVSPHRRNPILSAFLEQLRSPLIGILAGGAGLSLMLGATGDVLIIVTTILANVGVGVWQEYKANRVSEALERIGAATATVVRDGQPTIVSADEVVTGDVLLLSSGEHVAADARIVSSQNLEVDEASLTGESLPVAKTATGGNDASHIVLAGSDITTGTGQAVVFATGRQTRMGATAAALNVDESEQSPLGVRLSRLLRLSLPISIGGGILVILAGILRGQPVGALVATGATLALTAVPEGLPVLARVGEAGVARRLSERNAIVRRLSSVEALGRVDVACTDKTGTLTEGHLALSLVTTSSHDERKPSGESDTSDTSSGLSADVRSVLLTGALACPHPDAPDAKAHPTDIAVMQGAEKAGLDLHVPHEKELSFDPVRSFHVTLVEGRLCMKGAPEALISRCRYQMQHGEKEALDEVGQQALHEYATQLAARGLRVLMVAEGSAETPLDNPQGLTALGFLGISDPLRPNVRAAVQRCQEAGVRVIMITGDHPATARAIGAEAGLLTADNQVITGAELAELHNGEFEERLEQVTVIARATPLDKLRIVEGLQRRGHTVAMTGDGVNDAPALRLANVGVAMGQGGTEVARQTADLVLADDNFVTLVEALVEGRSFWRNIRRALGLLLGGNLGELGLVTGASLLGLAFPLTASQILAMNAITDILPATAVALQQPAHRRLADLSREGATALDAPLRNDILRRSSATGLPSLAAYGIMLGLGSLPQARSVAYGSIIATQLAQTLDAGRAEGTLTRTVSLAVAGSATVLLATFTIPPLRTFLSLVMPTPIGWALIGSSALVAVVMGRVLKSSLLTGAKPQLQLPALAESRVAVQA